MVKEFLNKNHKLILCIVITISIVSLSYFFRNSYIRIIESIKDLGLSIGYYFCELFYIPYSFSPTINKITNTSEAIINNFNFFNFSNFNLYFELGFNASLNYETFLRYLSNVLNTLSNITRFILIIMPLFILLIVKYRQYFEENDLDPNEDSKQLIRFKWIENHVIYSVKNWIQSFIDFVKRAIKYFGYKPKTIQTDNGQEFTFLKQVDKTHKFDLLCKELGIEHKLIKPRTPRYNGKVERSHRNDNERFYKYLKFYSFEDLQKQMKSYLTRSNNIPTCVLGWKSPLEKRKDLLLQNVSVV